MVCAEALLTALVGIVLGTVAAAVTVVPYAVVKTGSPIPAGQPWAYLAVVAGTIAITLLATLLPASRTMRLQPITALTH
jgi:putative ABC transport system permease protein